MSFLLRAALVIGALSYFAATRDQPSSGLGREAGATLTAAWQGLPQEARERVAQEAISEIGRRAAAGASRDTLAVADRREPWRGVEGR